MNHYLDGALYWVWVGPYETARPYVGRACFGSAAESDKWYFATEIGLVADAEQWRVSGPIKIIEPPKPPRPAPFEPSPNGGTPVAIAA